MLWYTDIFHCNECLPYSHITVFTVHEQETILVLACPKSMAVLFSLWGFANLAWHLIFLSECDPLTLRAILQKLPENVQKC